MNYVRKKHDCRCGTRIHTRRVNRWNQHLIHLGNWPAINFNDNRKNWTTLWGAVVMAAFGLLPDDASFGGVMSWVGLAVGVTVGTGLAAMVWPNIEASFSGMFGRGRA